MGESEGRDSKTSRLKSVQEKQSNLEQLQRTKQER